MTPQRPAVAFSLFALLAFSQVASAADVPPAAAAFLKTLEMQYSAVPSYKAVEQEGDSITISSLSLDGGAGKFSANIGSIELSEIEEGSGGLFEIGSAEYTDITFSINDAGQSFKISSPTIAMEDVYVQKLSNQPTDTEKLRARMAVARKATSGPISMTVSGVTVTADSYTATWDGDPVTGTGKSDMKVTNIVLPESALAAMDPSGTLKNLGYGALAMEVGGGGNMLNDGKALGFNGSVYYTIADLGTFRIGIDIGDISPAFMEAMQNMKPGDDGSSLLPLAQSISFGSMSFRFEDHSITNKVLPMIAQMQGMDVNTMKSNAGAMAQLGLAQLNSPEFTKQVVEAINAYLADPKSITIAASPAQRLTVAQMMGINPQDPASIIKMVGASVKAND